MSEPLRAGFRLHALELLRWGTFDGDCYHRLALGGSSGCVTGPNGGGKSTVVDALVTLLVPPDSRHYNVAASGEAKKKERTISTYVRGAWSRSESVETGKGQPTFLRETGIPSVLLATFQDELFSKAVTLVQLHWINANGKHEARFLLKPAVVSIPDLALDRNPVTHRKGFEDDGWYYGTSFDEYMGKFRTLLRIPDERALRLLCRTVSMKDITDLNVFVRDLMLEPREPGVLLDELERHHENLHRISEQIGQAEEEERLLTPLAKEYEIYEEQEKTINRLAELKRASDVFLAHEHRRLLNEAMAGVELELDSARKSAAQAKQDADNAMADQIRLQLRLEEHDVGKAIKQKGERLTQLREDHQNRQKRSNEYHALLTLIGRTDPVENEATFVQVRTRAQAGQNKAASEYEQAVGDLRDLERERNALTARIAGMQEELDQLGNRDSKIPPYFLKVRARLARALDLPEGELPFVGELIDVLPEEAKWRPTLERFLYSFALSLVVAHDRYALVSDYLEFNDPGVNLVYYSARRGTGLNFSGDRDRVYGKLTIKPNTWAASWLTGELMHRFDHLCTEDMNRFRKEEKVLTPRLHWKGRGGRHSRYTETTTDTTDYDILGWATAEKRARLERQQSELKQQREGLKARLGSLGETRTRARNEELTWGKIAAYATFGEIDHLTLETEIDGLMEEIERLTQSSQEFKELERQVATAKSTADALSTARTSADNHAGAVENRLKQLQGDRDAAVRKLNQAVVDDFPWQDHVPAIQESLKSPLVLEAFSVQRESILRRYDRQMTNAADTRGKAKEAAAGHVARIKAVCGGRAFTQDIGDSVAAAPPLLRYLSRLQAEKLPGLRTQFDEMMQDDLLKHVLTLNAELLRQVNDIKERVSEVNQTLATIDYSPGTYVRLRERETNDKNVGNFRGLLNACLVRQVLQTHAEMLESFERLKALIDYIKHNRAAALAGANSNNWLTFTVIESERATDRPITVSSDSAGDSGGQKAKLAFTILAAALCFQFRHSRQQDSNAFRLVMVDEMFSKSDDENSRYALDLFTRFDYQLMLVTPMEGKARLPMPYVKTYHLVSNPTKRASTITQVTVETVIAKEQELLARRRPAVT